MFAITISDDGRGIDLEKLRTKIVGTQTDNGRDGCAHDRCRTLGVSVPAWLFNPIERY